MHNLIPIIPSALFLPSLDPSAFLHPLAGSLLLSLLPLLLPPLLVRPPSRRPLLLARHARLSSLSGSSAARSLCTHLPPHIRHAHLRRACPLICPPGHHARPLPGPGVRLLRLPRSPAGGRQRMAVAGGVGGPLLHPRVQRVVHSAALPRAAWQEGWGGGGAVSWWCTFQLH